MVQLLAHVLDNVVTLLVIYHLRHEPVTSQCRLLSRNHTALLDVGIALYLRPLPAQPPRPLPGGGVTFLLQPSVTPLLDFLPVFNLLYWLANVQRNSIDKERCFIYNYFCHLGIITLCSL